MDNPAQWAPLVTALIVAGMAFGTMKILVKELERRVERLESKVDELVALVTTKVMQVGSLEEEVHRLRERYHDLANRITAALLRSEVKSKDA